MECRQGQTGAFLNYSLFEQEDWKRWMGPAESKEAYGGIAGGVIRECGGCSTYADESVAGAFIPDKGHGGEDERAFNDVSLDTATGRIKSASPRTC